MANSINLANVNISLRAAMEGRRLPLAPYVTDVAGMLKELDGTAKGGRKTMLMDFASITRRR